MQCCGHNVTFAKLSHPPVIGNHYQFSTLSKFSFLSYAKICTVEPSLKDKDKERRKNFKNVQTTSTTTLPQILI